MNIPSAYTTSEHNTDIVWSDVYIDRQVADGALTQYEFPCEDCDGCGCEPDKYKDLLRECPECHTSLSECAISVKTQYECKKCGAAMFLCVDSQGHPVVTAFLMPSAASKLIATKDDCI